MASPRWWLTLAGVALLSLGIRGTPARADVVPGDKINEQNMDKLKDLISPGREWVIKHGWPITITETKRIEFPEAYKEATEKYSGQGKLTADGRSRVNYVAARPFPKVDPKEPQGATEFKRTWGHT